MKTLKNKKDYEIALIRFEKIFQSKQGTKESDEADRLSILISDYEKIFYNKMKI